MRINHNYLKKFALFLYDVLVAFLASFAALVLVEYQNNDLFLNNILIYGCVMVALTFLVFYFMKLYASLWDYAGIEEFVKLTVAVLLIFVINISCAFITGLVAEERFIPIRWCLVFSMLQMFFTFMGRVVTRCIRYYRKGNKILGINQGNIGDKIRVMIVGAGEAGATLIREIRHNTNLGMYPVCLIDDDPDKLNQFMEGVKVVGNRDDIPRMTSRYEVDRIIIAIPSIKASELSKIIFICKDTHCKIQTVPGIYQMVNDMNMLSKVRDVSVNELLGREPINVNLDEINGYLRDKVVLVTGGGGSIGSELCRQIAMSNPKKLIILDIYENNAYEIEQELKREYKDDLDLLVLIASVRDKTKVDDIFEKYRPEIVFHAAAHKHVPLMETSPNEAVKNNVFGTYNVATAADKYGTKRFIMISTDKAVNPTNIMGATKRICEMIVQTINRKSKTEFVATRFGNVLGSNGSVIPLFKKQIENGGPVTVTHKDIVRYFMTIPEAVSLVLQAGSYAKGGEIFVLDMGEPVKIYDLAVNLIKLSGYTPGVDIKINIVGLRPGEKLYEEMLMEEEGLQDTPNKLIHIGKPIDLNEESLFSTLDELYKAAYSETDDMKSMVEQLVPTYKKDNN